MVENGPKKTLPTSRRVRVIHNHTFILDTTRALLVWEHDYYPHFYAVKEELMNCEISEKKTIERNGKVAAAVVKLAIPGHDGVEEAETDRVVYFAADESLGPLAGMVRLEFGSMGEFCALKDLLFYLILEVCSDTPAVDQWLEEETPIFVHPKDPFKRVDILTSQRPIEIKVDGKTIAKTSTSAHLLETGLPTRYYIPLGSVDPAVLRKSSLITKCPYKGEAEYYDVIVDGKEHKDIVWYYRHPTHESAAVADLVCFYNEKVDVYLDKVLQPRPKTPFG